MSYISGSGISSFFGAGFAVSNSSGSNVFNKSRRGISSSNSCNKYQPQSQEPEAYERQKLLDSKIDKIIIGVEPIGTGIGHGISYYTKPLRFQLPTYLGGGTFVDHLSCLIFFSGLFSSGPIILEFGAYYGAEPGYKNYIYYVYDSENDGGLRLSRMTESDYRAKVINGKKGAIVIDNLTIDNKMTLRDLIEKCKYDSSWKAKDYNLASHNCQDFIAKVIEILKVKRTDNDKTKYSHWVGKINYPPVILKALEKNDTPKALSVAQRLPVIKTFANVAGFLYSKLKKKD